MGERPVDKFDRPVTWLLVFSRHMQFWHNRIVPGYHKHVSAIGWLPRVQSWVFYNVGAYESTIFVVPDGEQAKAIIAKWCEGCTVVQVPQGSKSLPLWRRGLGLWCVPAVAHMVGSRSGAVLPDTFLRHCLRDGGEKVQDVREINTSTNKRSNVANAAGQAAECGPDGDAEADDIGHGHACSHLWHLCRFGWHQHEGTPTWLMITKNFVKKVRSVLPHVGR